jgi:transcriptional regulator with XRE-family HTH domain
MIKSDAQLRQAQERLRNLQVEREQLLARHGGHAPAYLLNEIDGDRRQIESEIREHQMLKQLPLEQAIGLIAQKPVLLENVGELLAKLRIAAKLTQEQLAQRLGWEQSNVSRFESNAYSSQTIGKVSEYLDGIGVMLYVSPGSLSPVQNVVSADVGEAIFQIAGQLTIDHSQAAPRIEDETLELTAVPA